MKIAIIGGGAAGFFSAISAKENYPDARVVIFHQSAMVTFLRVNRGVFLGLRLKAAQQMNGERSSFHLSF